jgi:hypothetical protein
MPDNPASKIKNFGRAKGSPRANRPWADDERHAVLQEAPPHMKPAIAIMMFTGLGLRDALTLPRSSFRSGEIVTNRSKTGELVILPAAVELRQILEAAPSHHAITCVQIPWAAMDHERLQCVMGDTTPAPAARTIRPGRLGSHSVRLEAHPCRHPSGDRLRLAHDCGRPRPNDRGDGSALFERR